MMRRVVLKRSQVYVLNGNVVLKQYDSMDISSSLVCRRKDLENIYNVFRRGPSSKVDNTAAVPKTCFSTIKKFMKGGHKTA